jgi:hypothetical protein
MTEPGSQPSSTVYISKFFSMHRNTRVTKPDTPTDTNFKEMSKIVVLNSWWFVCFLLKIVCMPKLDVVNWYTKAALSNFWSYLDAILAMKTETSNYLCEHICEQKHMRQRLARQRSQGSKWSHDFPKIALLSHLSGLAWASFALLPLHFQCLLKLSVEFQLQEMQMGMQFMMVHHFFSSILTRMTLNLIITSSFLDCASALALSRLIQAWIFASSLWYLNKSKTRKQNQFINCKFINTMQALVLLDVLTRFIN